MKITYDPEVDVLRIIFNEASIGKNVGDIRGAVFVNFYINCGPQIEALN